MQAPLLLVLVVLAAFAVAPVAAAAASSNQYSWMYTNVQSHSATNGNITGRYAYRVLVPDARQLYTVTFAFEAATNAAMGELTTKVQLSFTSRAFDTLAIGNETCGNFEGPTVGSVVTAANAGQKFRCDQVASCVMTTGSASTASSATLRRAATISGPPPTVTIPGLHTVSAVLGSGASIATCGATALSAVFYFSAKQRTTAVSSYAALLPTTTNVATMNAIETAGFWGGALPTAQLATFPGAVGVKIRNATSTRIVDDYRLFRFATRTDQHVDSNSVELSETGARHVYCEAHNLLSFRVFQSNGQGADFECGTHLTLDALHTACIALGEDCVGFTTKIVNQRGEWRESPNCLKTAGRLARAAGAGVGDPTDAGSITDALFYKRPDDANCATNTQTAGEVTVYVAQTFFASGFVDVRVDNLLVKTCGYSEQFINRTSGRNGHCHMHFPCYVGAVGIGSRIEVIASGGTFGQGDCEKTLGVLFHLSSVAAVQYNTTTFSSAVAGIELTQYNYSRPLSKPVTETASRNGYAIKIHAHNLRQILLSVQQSVMNCNGTSSDNSQCPASMITLTAGSANGSTITSRCGGQAGFVQGPGLSDQCAVAFYCSLPLVLSTTSSGVEQGWTGLITISIDVSPFYSPSFLPPCNYFSGALYAITSDSTVQARATPGSQTAGMFPFLSQTISAANYNVMLLTENDISSAQQSTAGASSIDAASQATLDSYFNNASNLRNIQLMTSFTTYTKRYDAFFYDHAGQVNADAFTSNVSTGCIIDHVGAARGYCDFTVPTASNHFTLRFIETDIAQSTVTVTFSKHDGTESEVLCTTAGTSSVGEGACQTLFTCATGFLYANDTLGNNGRYQTMRVSAPNTVQSGGCQFAVAVIVDFAAVTVATPVCPADVGYLCVRDRRCLPLSALCDAVSDCSDGADEALCTAWHLVERGRELDATSYASHVTNLTAISSLATCRQSAVVIAATGFAFSKELGCTLYASTYVDRVVGQPTVFSAASTRDLYLYMPSTSVYKRCSRFLHCNDLGAIEREPEALDGGTCTCLCEGLYTGSDCSIAKAVDTINTLIVQMPSTPDSPSVVVLSTVLTLQDDAITATVGYLQLLNGELTAAVDIASSTSTAHAAAHRDLLLSNGSITTINGLLQRFGMSGVSHVTTESVFVPWTSLSCGVASADYTYCAGIHGDARELRITAGSAGNAITVTYDRLITKVVAEVSDITGARRAIPGYEIVTHTCNRANVVDNTGTGGCDVVVCIIDVSEGWTLPAGEVIHDYNITIGNVNASDNSHNKGTGTCSVEIEVEVISTPTLPTTTTTESVILTHPDESGYYIAAIVVLLVCVAAFVTAVVCLVYDIRRVSKRRTEVSSAVGTMSAVSLWVATTFGTMQHYEGEQYRMKDMTDIGAIDDEDSTAAKVLTQNPDGAATSASKPSERVTRAEITDANVVRRRLDKVSVLAFVLSGATLVTGGLLLVMYYTAGVTTSNFSLIVEDYYDGSCRDSVYSPVPHRIALLGYATECAALRSAGSAKGLVYASGFCGGGGLANSTSTATTLHVDLAIATSLATCAGLSFVRHEAGKCISQAELYGDAERGGYSLLTCTTNALASGFFEDFEASTVVKWFTRKVTPTTMHADFAPALNSSSTFAYTFVTNGQKLDSTTTMVDPTAFDGASTAIYASLGHRLRADSIATAADLVGERRANRLVGQTLEMTYAPGLGEMPLTTATEATFLETQNALDVAGNITLRRFVPTTADYPIGFIYGSFGQPVEQQSSLAASTSHRYFDVQSTLFDMGSRFGYVPTTGTTIKVQEFTVSLWLRASDTTLGFAFAVTDGWLDATTQQNPVLDTMTEILSNGRPSTAWFSDVWRIYSSLFVNGAARTLQFVYADPTMQNKTGAEHWCGVLDSIPCTTDGQSSNNNPIIVSLLWNLDSMGAPEVFNGAWHNIAIVFSITNGKASARMVIDGSTDYTLQAWTECVTRLPSQVADLPSPTVTGDDLHQIAVAGGVLTTGYFNGGLYGLEFTPAAKEQVKISRFGTRQMHIKNAIRKQSWLTMGYFLIFCALVAFLFVFFQTRYEVYLAGRHDFQQADLVSFAGYYNLFGKPLLDHTDARNPYRAIKYVTAMRWLDISSNPGHIQTVIKECNATATQLVSETEAEADGLEDVALTGSVKVVEPLRRKFERPSDHTSNTKVLPVTASHIVVSALFRHRKQILAATQTGVKRTDDDLESESFGLPTADEWHALIDEDAAYMAKQHAIKFRCFLRMSEPWAEEDPPYDLASATAAAVEQGVVSSQAASEGGNSANSAMQGTTSSSASSSSSTVSTAQLVLPVIHVLQQLSVYTVSWSFPAVYQQYFNAILAIIAFDISLAFPHIPTVVTLLVQLVLTFVVVVLIFYLATIDNKTFLFNTARYTHRRDEKQALLDEMAEKRTVDAARRRASVAPDAATASKKPDGGGLFGNVLRRKASSASLDESPPTATVSNPLLGAVVNVNTAIEENAEVEPAVPTTTVTSTPVLQTKPNRLFGGVGGGAGIFARIAKLATRVKKKFLSQREKLDRRCVVEKPYGADTAPWYGYTIQLLPAFERYAIDEFRRDTVKQYEALVQPLPDALADIESRKHRVSRHVLSSIVSNREELIGSSMTVASVSDGVFMRHSEHSAAEQPAAGDLGNHVDIRVERKKHHLQFACPNDVFDDVTFGNIEEETLPVKDTEHENTWRAVVDIGVRCWEHPDRILFQRNQNSVYPYVLPATCCVVEKGQRCGASTGMMYVCGKPCCRTETARAGAAGEEDLVEEVDYDCGFAVCDKHFRPTLVQRVASMAAGARELLRQRGPWWIIGLILIVLSSSIYMPVARTALMVVSCHPYYQCHFTQCWTKVDQEFAISAYFSGVVLIFFILGLPFFQLMLLRTRKGYLTRAFHGREYKGRYLESVEDALLSEKVKAAGEQQDTGPPIEERIINRIRAITGDRLTGRVSRIDPLSTERPDSQQASEVVHMQSINGAVSPNDMSVLMSASGFQQSPSSLMAQSTMTMANAQPALRVKLSEWSRFLDTDPSMLTTLYNQLRFEWMYLSPAILFFKMVLLAPPVLLEPRSLGQLAGVGAVELLYAVFMFWTSPFAAPLVDYMYRIGSVHQLLIVGFQALHTVALYDNNGHAEYYSWTMVSITVIYIVTVVLLIVVHMGGPVLEKQLVRRRGQQLLRRLQLPMSQFASLFVVPSPTGYVRFDVGAAAFAKTKAE
jgi:hypothetical protein